MKIKSSQAIEYYKRKRNEDIKKNLSYFIFLLAIFSVGMFVAIGLEPWGDATARICFVIFFTILATGFYYEDELKKQKYEFEEKREELSKQNDRFYTKLSEAEDKLQKLEVISETERVTV